MEGGQQKTVTNMQSLELNSTMNHFFINVYQSADGHEYISGTRFYDRGEASKQPQRLECIGLRRVGVVKIMPKVLDLTSTEK